MNGWELRKIVGREELDTLTLNSVLSAYNNPRDKISRLVKEKVLIRIKKGLYIFGPQYSEKPYSNEVLANLIFGPSAISLEYALSYYGLIPEKVYAITSITPKRNKLYETPVGRFSYKHMAVKKFAVGIDLLEINPGQHFMMATPEKALADQLLLKLHGQQLNDLQELEEHLFENLRIDREVFMKCKVSRLLDISKAYKNSNVELLFQYLIKMR